MGDHNVDEQGPVTRGAGEWSAVERRVPGSERWPVADEAPADWAERGHAAHERPSATRHELPGTIAADAYRVYHHDGRWAPDDRPLARTGRQNLLVTDEWLTYAVDAREAGPHDLGLRVAAADGFGGGCVGVAVDDDPRVRVSFDPTGGWDRWGEVRTRVRLDRGVQTVRLTVLEGGWKLDRLRVE